MTDKTDRELLELAALVAKFIEVKAEVRYWEDATVNGVEDLDGGLIPFKTGLNWCPVICVESGQIVGWPIGTRADIHYKVCDAGQYWLLNENKERVGKWAGDYVPSKFLCHGDDGYGDYIIFKVGADGRIENYKSPQIEWTCDCDENDQGGWKAIDAAMEGQTA